MSDASDSFDTSRLQALANIRAEQKALRELASRAAVHRDKVAEVYARVVKTYEARIEAVEGQAEQLRGQVQADFEKVEEVYRDAAGALDQAESDVQENEFRYAIGEFSKDEFARRLAALEQTIAAKRAELDRLGRLRQECLSLLGADAPSRPEAPGAPRALPAAPPALPRAAATSAAAIAALTAPGRLAAGSMPPVAAVSGQTQLPGTLFSEVAGPSQGEPPPADDAATHFFASTPWGGEAREGAGAAERPAGVALLLEERAGGESVPHELGERAGIGRTTDNQIVVSSREVSRRHAEVIRGPDGYTVRDLSTPNGSFVNGERVQERRLQDGDRITIGPQAFVFKVR